MRCPCIREGFSFYILSYYHIIFFLSFFHSFVSYMPIQYSECGIAYKTGPKAKLLAEQGRALLFCQVFDPSYGS